MNKAEKKKELVKQIKSVNPYSSTCTYMDTSRDSVLKEQEESAVLTTAENARLTAEERAAIIDDILRMLKELGAHGKKESAKESDRIMTEAVKPHLR